MRIPEDPFKNFDYENIKFKYYREWKDKNKESLEKEKFILEAKLETLLPFDDKEKLTISLSFISLAIALLALFFSYNDNNIEEWLFLFVFFTILGTSIFAFVIQSNSHKESVNKLLMYRLKLNIINQILENKKTEEHK